MRASIRFHWRYLRISPWIKVCVVNSDNSLPLSTYLWTSVQCLLMGTLHLDSCEYQLVEHQFDSGAKGLRVLSQTSGLLVLVCLATFWWNSVWQCATDPVKRNWASLSVSLRVMFISSWTLQVCAVFQRGLHREHVLSISIPEYLRKFQDVDIVSWSVLPRKCGPRRNLKGVAPTKRSVRETCAKTDLRGDVI